MFNAIAGPRPPRWAGLGQRAISGLLDLKAVASQVRRAVSSMKTRKKRDIGKVVRHRNVAANADVLSGTRIPTATIWRFHNAGFTVEQIINEFPRLQARDVHKAIEHEQKRLAS